MKGSPPRVRGKVQLFQSIKRCDRITPACAGKRRDGRRLKYPGLGSPPRVRGKARHISSAFSKKGITPACAGKSWTVNRRQITVGDHPRVCGEKPMVEFTMEIKAGSPPRVRGKGKNSCFSRKNPRITPACAGKSFNCIGI